MVIFHSPNKYYYAMAKTGTMKQAIPMNDRFESRFDYQKVAPGAYKAMDALDGWIARCDALDPVLIDLARLRASQLNGCVYCVDLHWRDLRDKGVPERRLAALPTWRESAIFDNRERAVLEWTEAVTFIHGDRADDASYRRTVAVLGESVIAALTVVIATINAWNRLSIAARLQPEIDADSH